MWAYRARDVVATVAHGMWGAFWMAFGILQILTLAGKLPAATPGTSNSALGLWFFGLAFMTAIIALAATFENLGIAAVLWTLTAGSAFTCIGWFHGGIGSHWLGLGGVLFIVSAGLAAYMTLAMSLHAMTGRTILPLGHYKKDANVPGRQPTEPIELAWAEPGVKKGQ